MKADFWYESVGPVEAAIGGDHAKLKAMTPNQQLAHHLREYRRAWRLSQVQLARKAGTTQRVVSLIEVGKYNPSLDLVERLALACGMRVVLSFQRKAQD
jgi:putative transcriptional regulator